MIDVFDIFRKENIDLVTEYTGYKNPLKIKCSYGHITTITVNNAALRVKRGVPICKECKRLQNEKKLRKKISDLLHVVGYTLISSNVSYSNKFIYMCNNGHINSMYISNLMNGRYCPDCYGNKLTKYKNIKKIFKKEGYKVIGFPDGSKSVFECECANGHRFNTTYDNFVNRGRRCLKCSKLSSSKQEDELYYFVSSLYNGTIIRNDREILDGKELDIVFPDIKLAIEYCGLYWHSELKGKDRNYHLNKLNMCNNSGYKLITIFEDEWVLSNDKCKSRLASYINSSGMRRIYARKCKVREISSKTIRSFCNDNHMQKYGSGSSIKLGLFFEDELVSILSFSRPSLAKGRKDSSTTEYELHRFCSLLNTVVVGGASKLLSYFERNYDCDKIFTFADKRWSFANLYYRLGFTLIGESDPCYYYFKDNLVRQHRFLYRKNVLEKKLDVFDPNLTEVENMYANGYNRIWDCGNWKLEKTYVIN